ncbi:hypothetical protein BDA99DRAFT_149128 [Phascolomyces articulosus]|uniref:RRM domain-containing protein n=1 Tax=Phascolomyces articulosus TaxID=60185 RepID=A0AAD5K5R1_9FUNG|nr:hypothetical protein BDA99DRAFT_149128 [Phascolomyces articulosus]
MSYYGDRDRDRGSRRPSRRLYVGNLNRYVRERDVERLFAKLGRINDLALMSNFAFIEYDDERDAEDAVRNLHGTRLEGDRIIVEFAKNKPRNNRGYDRDRGGRRNDRFGGERCYNCGEVGMFFFLCFLSFDN